MHIGLDLDDVTTPLIPDLLDFFNKKYNLNKSIEDVYDWDFFPKEIHEEFRKSGGYLRQRLMPGAKELLEKLRLKGDQISMITYRSQEYENQTIQSLEKNISGLYDKAYFTGGPKLPTCRNLGIQLLIDDSKTQVPLITKEMGIHAILFRTNINKRIKDSGLIHVAENMSQVEYWIEKLRPEIER